MTVLTAAQAVLRTDAAPPRLDWHSINWAQCHAEVRKLQVRIAKATREGRWRKVKALQWLLTHSFSGKALAVRRVTENQGKRTAGVDGVTWSTPEAKANGLQQLKRRGYQPKPLRRVYIPKSNGKLRPLGIPTMRDRAMQALHLLALEPVSESRADHDSYGFRPERSAADAIQKLFGALHSKGSAQWVLEGDIKGCFDHISHKWMLENICTDTRVLEKWLGAGYIDNKKLFPTVEGTPQGGIISPTLANIVLDGLEDLLIDRFGRTNGPKRRQARLGARTQVHFVRYADDFVITGSSKDFLENEVRPLVRDFLASRGLTLSEEKTRVTRVADGFDFLGQNVRKYNFGSPGEILLIKPSTKNVKTFLEGVRDTIRKLRTAKQSVVIATLNPKITGWANYHRHIVAKHTYTHVDNEIWHALWRWAKRRHRNKSAHWILAKYFKRVGPRNLRFSCQEVDEKGNRKLSTLKFAVDVAITRLAKIVGEANPYDPQFEEYFEKRTTLKMESNLRGRRKLIYLWKRQEGRCPLCKEKITAITRWHVHHLVRRVDGGSDASSNLWLLHPDCHRQGHASGFRFVLPVAP